MGKTLKSLDSLFLHQWVVIFKHLNFWASLYMMLPAWETSPSFSVMNCKITCTSYILWQLILNCVKNINCLEVLQIFHLKNNNLKLFPKEMTKKKKLMHLIHIWSPFFYFEGVVLMAIYSVPYCFLLFTVSTFFYINFHL